MSDTSPEQRVLELVQDSQIAMMTYVDPSGTLVSKPMATQDVQLDRTLVFITERSSDKVHALQLDPRVNVSYSNRGSWVSVAGKARVVDDVERLRELWDGFTGSWLEGGPENPENVLIEVDAESAEYWAGPGDSTVISLVNLVKARVTGSRIDADHETVDL